MDNQKSTESQRVFNRNITIPVCKRPNCSGGKKIDAFDNILEDENGKTIYCQCHYEEKYLDANIGFSYWPVNVQTYDGHPKDLEAMLKYFNKAGEMFRTGMGLYVHGPYGAGKTSLVMLFLKFVLHHSPCSAMFAPFSDVVILNTRIVGGYHDKSADKSLDVIKNVDFLVLDDLGKEFDNNKDYARATLNSLIRYRDLWNKPTIYTANVPLEDLRESYGNSNFSILEGRSDVITMENDQDYRKWKKAQA